MIRKEIEKLIQKAIKELQKDKIFPELRIPEIKIEHPEEKIHGDYATNVAMVIGKILKTTTHPPPSQAKLGPLNPMEIANILGSRLQILGSKFFEKVEIVQPGFINFFLSKNYLQEQVKEILKSGEKFGQLKIGKNQKVQVEFISANPTGSLHIGNGRGAFFGDTLANVFQKTGHKVAREYYINDAKANTQIKILGETALGKGITYLTGDLKLKIEKLKPKLEKISDEGKAGHLLAQEVQKEIKDFIGNKLKIKFDNWVSEETLYEENKVDKIFNWLKKKNLVYQREGAWWIRTSEFGDKKDWVVIRETGEPTYLMSDIAYHKDKFDRGFKKIINIWGADHQGHVQKMKAVAKILGFKGNLDILISQIVRLKGGIKISKRKGTAIDLEWLIDEVGLDVARFFYLIKSLDTQMEFDIKLAKEKSAKSPVYYVQYAHARICSIIRKYEVRSTKKRKKISLDLQTSDFRLLVHPSGLELIKQLIRLPEIIEDTAKDYQAQRLSRYTVDLATVFHQFYRDCRVISEDKKLTQARLSLVLAAKTVLKNTLDLIGISAPEKM